MPEANLDERHTARRLRAQGVDRRRGGEDRRACEESGEVRLLRRFGLPGAVQRASPLAFSA
jgi:hypothetical protein